MKTSSAQLDLYQWDGSSDRQWVREFLRKDLIEALDRAGLLTRSIIGAVAENPDNALALVYTLHRPIPAVEPMLASNPSTAYDYAENILHGRFLAGEPEIMKIDDFREQYIRSLIKFVAPDQVSLFGKKMPWTDAVLQVFRGEQGKGFIKGISRGLERRTPQSRVAYLEVNMLPLLQDEALVQGFGPDGSSHKVGSLRTASSQLDLAQLHGVINLGEVLERHGFMTKRIAALRAPWAVAYAERTHRRFPEGEPAIAGSATWSLVYAFKVLEHQWDGPYKGLAETTLFKDSERDFRLYRSLLRETPVQASVRTASSQLRLSWHTPELFEVLARSGMDKRIKQAILDMKLNPYHLWELVRNHWGYGQSSLQSQRLPWPEVERIFIDQYVKGPQDYALAYARVVIRSRWPEAEPLFAQDLKDIFWYSSDCLRGRFPAGEPLVAKHLLAEDNDDSDFGQACRYWDKWIGDPSGIPEYETNGAMSGWAKAILAGKTATLKTASGQLTIQQVRANGVLRALDRFGTKAIKAAIYTSPNMAMNFARAVGRPVPEGEPAIATDADYSYYYALNNSKPFPGGEPAIAQDPMLACRYAMSVLHTRWPEIEPMIAKTILTSGGYENYRLRTVIANYYWSLIAKNDMQEDEGVVCVWAESVLENQQPVQASAKTASSQIVDVPWTQLVWDLIKSRFYSQKFRKAAEPRIAQDGVTSCWYARALGERFPAGEPAIVRSCVTGNLMNYYMSFVHQGKSEATWDDCRKWMHEVKQSQGAAKTASSQLPPNPHWEGVLGALMQHGLMSKGIQQATITHLKPMDLAHIAEQTSRPWTAAEPSMLQDSFAAAYYALYVLDHRWPEAEPAMRETAHHLTHGLTLPLPVLHYFNKFVTTGTRYPDHMGPAQTYAVLGDRTLAWLQHGKTAAAETKTASTVISLDSILPAPDSQGFDGYIRWMDALHRHGMETKALYQAYLSNPWIATSYAGTCQGWKASPEVLSAIQNDSAALDWYYEESEANGVLPDPEPEEPHFASLAVPASRTASSGLSGVRSGDLSFVLDALARSGLGKSVRDLLASYSPADLLHQVHLLGYRYPHMRLPWPEVEAVFLKDPDYATVYAYQLIAGPWPAAEPVIATGGEASYRYAVQVLKARFPAGEPAIARMALAKDQTGRFHAVEYWRKFVSGPWAPGQPLMPDEQATRVWARLVLGMPTPVRKKKQASSHIDFSDVSFGNLIGVLQRHGMLTKNLMQLAIDSFDPADAINAVRAYGRPWPELEPVLVQDPSISADYAEEILHARFPEAEQEWYASVRRGEWRDHVDVPYTVDRYYFNLVRDRRTPRYSGDWKDPLAWLLGGSKLASAKTASAHLDRNFLKLSTWTSSMLTALHRCGFMSKPLLSAAASNPKSAYFYARATDAPFPAGEDVIAPSSFAGPYALNVLNDRWPRGEKAIAEDILSPDSPGYTSRYWSSYIDEGLNDLPAEDAARAWAKQVVGARPVQAKTASSQLQWAPDCVDLFTDVADALRRYGFMSNRILEAISSNPRLARVYARDFIRGRWPEAETAIAADPRSAFLYAKDEIKGPWPEAEPALFTTPRFAALYAAELLKGRWPAAEPVIARGDDWDIGTYTKKVLHLGFQMDRDVWLRENLAKTPVFAPAPLKRSRKPKAPATA